MKSGGYERSVLISGQPLRGPIHHPRLRTGGRAAPATAAPTPDPPGQAPCGTSAAPATPVREALAARQRPNAVGEKPEAAPAPAARAEPVQHQADPAAAYWKTLAKAPREAPGEDRLQAKVREALAARQRSNAAGEQPAAARAPDARAESAERRADSAAAFWKATAAKAPREVRGEDRLQAKVRELLAARQRNAAGEKPAPDAPRQVAARSPSEDERAPAALLPAWRDPTGQGRDSLGRGTSPEDLARVANQDPAVLREDDGRKWAMQTIYRDPEAAGDALDALIKTSGNDLWEAARKLEAGGGGGAG